jgi:hypothetical protein
VAVNHKIRNQKSKIKIKKSKNHKIKKIKNKGNPYFFTLSVRAKNTIKPHNKKLKV